ncbi:ABC transporter permease [Polyangium jinanense]|uniref:ABC transporter permease n=1 Tax=Polyangium jinanense TaxID=2829994 RepID=A0A9X3X1Z9_9BACT|nr:ABC transporter permease [Polyangium jinanense]MDC3982172.1 ABC transporter permease [Polyangium jinanense]
MAVVVAIALGVGFLVATSVFASTTTIGLQLTAAAPLTKADIYLENKAPTKDPSWFREVSREPNIATVDPVYARTVEAFGQRQRGTANVLSLPENPQARWFRLREGGRWPSGPAEVVADDKTLAELGVHVGDTVRLRSKASPMQNVKITGVAELGFQPLVGVSYRFYAAEAFFAGDTPTVALALVRDPSKLQATIQRLENALPGPVEVSSAREQSAAAAGRFVGGSNALTFIMLAFALLSLLAAVLVIANTFSILLTQRRRQTALLRLLGAHRNQVRNLILAEATIVGTIGSVVGTALGVLLGFAGASYQKLAAGGLQINTLALLACNAIGVASTVIAAWFPARHAIRVPPAQALRTAPDAMPSRQSRRVVFVLASTLVIIGAAVAAAGIRTVAVAPVVVGGFVSAVGILTALRRVVMLLLPVVERGFDRLGVAAEIAGSNLRCNPERTGSAVTALVLGTALIVALGVAAKSGQATVDADLQTRYPVDLSVRTDAPVISAETVRAIASLPGLSITAALPETAVELPPAAGQEITTLLGAPSEVIREAGMTQLSTVTPDRPPAMLLPGRYLAAAGLSEGATVTAVVDGARHEFVAYASKWADTTGPTIGIVRADILSSISRTSTQRTVWAIAAPSADRDALQSGANTIAAMDPSITVSGALSERGDIANILSILVNMSVAMLLVTVLIAVIGLANMLRLSVLERTREISLLRALGMRRAGVRTMLLLEAAGISLLGAALGAVIGLPYGLLGIAAVVGRRAALVTDIPWWNLLAVTALVVLAGMLASVFPSRRAARIAPAEGLVDE